MCLSQANMRLNRVNASLMQVTKAIFLKNKQMVSLFWEEI